MTKALPTQAEIDAGPHGGIGTIPTDYIPDVPLVGTLSVLPDHVKSCVVAYGNARVAVALKHIAAPGAAIAAREPCATCGASEPFTGSCGTSDSDTRALCKRASRQEAPAASVQPACTCCGCGGCKSCLSGRNRCPKHSAARSPATVAQPVGDGGEALKQAAADAVKWLNSWFSNHDGNKIADKLSAALSGLEHVGKESE